MSVAAPKSKLNGSGAKGKTGKAAVAARSPTASGTATPSVVEENAGPSHGAKPNKEAYHKEQEELKAKIEELQKKISAVQEKINSGSGSGPGAERRAELSAQWDEIRQEQSKFKNSRGQIMAQLKTMNENIAKKIKDLQAAKSKTPYKTVAEVDERIKQLEKQVESGTMKLADEKRALQEIGQIKRQRRTVESFQAEQETIDRDKAAADELRRQIDDPEAKAVHDRADAIKAELDKLKKDRDEVNAGRDKLFKERNELKAEVDKLYDQKRQSAANYKETNDRYWLKINEDRTRRAERAKRERLADEERKRTEVAQRLREEAEAPAYQAEIEDCQTLIDYFSGRVSGAVRLKSVASVSAEPRAELTNVPKLELRQVDADTSGLVAVKKKGDDDEAYFVAGGGKKKGKKSNARSANASAGDSPGSGALNVPFPTLSALLALSIPPPTSQADVPQTVENLKIKKAWFEANSARQTAENVAKAEANIKRLLNGGKADAASPDLPPNGDGEKPAEPAPTPAKTDVVSDEAPLDQVDAQLEEEVEAESAV